MKGDKPVEDSRLESLLREKEALSHQVRMLTRAEGKLYEYQEELDSQLNEYKHLHDFSRTLNATLKILGIFRETVSYLIQYLEYQRAVILHWDEQDQVYRVCASDGYYTPQEKEGITGLALPPDAPALSPLFHGNDHLICCSGTEDPEIRELGARLLMADFLLYPLGTQSPPPALLLVGNSAEDAVFYRKIDMDPAALHSIGNVVGIVSSVLETRIFFDQLEKARGQERMAEARYRSIFENAIEGIFQRTPAGRYIDANRALARTLGYASSAELIASVDCIRDQLYVDQSDHDQLMALLERNGSVESFETRMYRKDRRIIWVSISMRMVRDDEGRVLYFEGTTEEITERKRGEEALRESEQKYRQLSASLEKRVKDAVDEILQKDKILILQGRQAVMGEMISNIAHQWRQPLNMLALLVQDLQITRKKQGLTEEFVENNVRRSLEIIRQMSKTIDYFRYFFMPDKEKVEFRVVETIEKTLTILNGSFKSCDIQVNFSAAGDPVISGFPTEFVQVLLNILLNARDALVARKVESPLISINLATEGNKTTLIIADNAGGIPEEIMDRIFDPYFTTKGPEQGTGIGLFMSKTIIEKNMGGRLSVRNVGGGAEFRIEV